MRVELGESVRSSDGQKLGTIKHLILDPTNSQIKTLVVEKGFLLPNDVEIPLEAVQDTGGEGLCVRYTADQVKDLPRFDLDQYTSVPSEYMRAFPGLPYAGMLWPAGYPLQPFGVVGSPQAAPVLDGEMVTAPQPEEEERLLERNAENAVISVGDDVVSHDGQKVGEVRNITFDSVTGRPTSVTVRQGWLFHKDWLLPADEIASVTNGVVYLNLDKARLQTRRDEEQYTTEWGQNNRATHQR